MIYDCFSFFNELDLLEIRLNVLKDAVDRFVLVEATRTHTGAPKPLFYAENKARLAAFADRIIHVVADDFAAADAIAGERERAWAVENIQRNAIARGLSGAAPGDTVLISDLDEIPDPAAVRKAAGSPGITRLGMRIYNYYLNFRNYSTPQWTLGTQVLSYAAFTDPATYRGFRFGEFAIASVNAPPSATMIRMGRQNRFIRDAGWHFTYLGGVEAVRRKIMSIAHTEYNTPETRSDEWIKARIAAGEDPFRRGDRFFADEIDGAFPEYLRCNRSRYSHLILPVAEGDAHRTRLRRFAAKVRGAVRRTLARAVPPFLVPAAIRFLDRLHGVKRGT
ncbi:MAG: hypothetical protein J6T01_03645 [Kiritimatiellae bacterium]|nr:hypothetical protein [Kiritimatiellia bacterium]